VVMTDLHLPNTDRRDRPKSIRFHHLQDNGDMGMKALDIPHECQWKCLVTLCFIWFRHFEEKLDSPRVRVKASKIDIYFSSETQRH
jgi:hypothetical protein